MRDGPCDVVKLARALDEAVRWLELAPIEKRRDEAIAILRRALEEVAG
jgi:hypothetical protein